ncbi:MAG: GDP-mannose--undecaprenyl-phosphate mannosyltransferase [Chthonomonadaceae bacterium]|nr:GDP-mannose--undecaprenyl-phosphate mannosyltransferase [Chthonomonadaceae bacterium]
MNAIIVVPTYNEAENVEQLVASVFAQVPDIHMLFVDDESPDGTGDILDNLARLPWIAGRLHVLHRTAKDGFARAYIAGFQWSLARDYDLIIQMDADMSHDPIYLPKMIQASDKFDIVIGSRYLNGISVVNWPLRRILLSYFANRYVNSITALNINDCTSGFKILHRRVLENIALDTMTANGYSFQVELLYRAHILQHSFTEIPIIFADRVLGESKMSGKTIREAFIMPLKLRLIKNRLKRQLTLHAQRQPAE